MSAAHTHARSLSSSSATRAFLLSLLPSQLAGTLHSSASVLFLLHFTLLRRSRLTLQGAVASDLFNSLLALQSGRACECPRGGESECLVLSTSLASCVCECMLRDVSVTVYKEGERKLSQAVCRVCVNSVFFFFLSLCVHVCKSVCASRQLSLGLVGWLGRGRGRTI